MNASGSFFAADENLLTLNRFLSQLESYRKSENSHLNNIIVYLVSLTKAVIRNPKTFDECCQSNIDWIGSSHIAAINTCITKSLNEEVILVEEIFANFYRFLNELEFSRHSDLSHSLYSVKLFVEQSFGQFNEAAQKQLVYANYLMPASILKKIVFSEEIKDFRDFSVTATELRLLKKNWDHELERKRSEITTLQDGLSKIKTSYNFVGLVKGFESMASIKEDERRNTLTSLFTLGIIMLLPILFNLIHVIKHSGNLKEIKELMYFLAPISLTLEVILFYFFRIVLVNYRNTRSQLLQLSLRVTLCQFIQSYSDYSVQIKKQDPAALEKFENLVFGNFAADTDQLPNAFDWAEQLSKLANAIKKPSQN